mmetsp:Transcript_51396/g.123644  ORF Transcript_51396/g.123644 Transcript_51396/m.123644 type:complete len:315 (-) Transcript_51396:382-1326(-)
MPGRPRGGGRTDGGAAGAERGLRLGGGRLRLGLGAAVGVHAHRAEPAPRPPPHLRPRRPRRQGRGDVRERGGGLQRRDARHRHGGAPALASLRPGARQAMGGQGRQRAAAGEQYLQRVRHGRAPRRGRREAGRQPRARHALPQRSLPRLLLRQGGRRVRQQEVPHGRRRVLPTGRQAQPVEHGAHLRRRDGPARQRAAAADRARRPGGRPVRTLPRPRQGHAQARARCGGAAAGRAGAGGAAQQAQAAGGHLPQGRGAQRDDQAAECRAQEPEGREPTQGRCRRCRRESCQREDGWQGQGCGEALASRPTAAQG